TAGPGPNGPPRVCDPSCSSVSGATTVTTTAPAQHNRTTSTPIRTAMPRRRRRCPSSRGVGGSAAVPMVTSFSSPAVPTVGGGPVALHTPSPLRVRAALRLGPHSAGYGGRVAGPEDLVRASRDAGVDDPRVLAAVGAIRRADFVPPGYADVAYRDRPIPIPHDQVTTQPSLSARMVQALRLRGDERVLEVGTGYGYQTALLARLAAHVTSVERWPDLAEAARRHLDAAGVDNVRVV